MEDFARELNAVNNSWVGLTINLIDQINIGLTRHAIGGSNGDLHADINGAIIDYKLAITNAKIVGDTLAAKIALTEDPSIESQQPPVL